MNLRKSVLGISKNGTMSGVSAKENHACKLIERKEKRGNSLLPSEEEKDQSSWEHMNLLFLMSTL